MTTEAHTFALGILANLLKYPPLYICREPSTNSPLIMQNKPNFSNNKIDINPFMTNYYEQKPPLRQSENKPNSNPISPSILSEELASH